MLPWNLPAPAVIVVPEIDTAGVPAPIVRGEAALPSIVPPSMLTVSAFILARLNVFVV